MSGSLESRHARRAVTLQKVKILFLSDDSRFLLFPALARVSSLHEIHFDFLLEVEDLGNQDVYQAPDLLCKEITRRTQGNMVDLVIIMNNMGAGLKKAQAVDPKMRKKTIVIWGMEVRGAWEYEELGIPHLGSQRELASLIVAALGLTA